MAVRTQGDHVANDVRPLSRRPMDFGEQLRVAAKHARQFLHLIVRHTINDLVPPKSGTPAHLIVGAAHALRIERLIAAGHGADRGLAVCLFERVVASPTACVSRSRTELCAAVHACHLRSVVLFDPAFAALFGVWVWLRCSALWAYARESFGSWHNTPSSRVCYYN